MAQFARLVMAVLFLLLFLSFSFTALNGLAIKSSSIQPEATTKEVLNAGVSDSLLALNTVETLDAGVSHSQLTLNTVETLNVGVSHSQLALNTVEAPLLAPSSTARSTQALYTIATSFSSGTATTRLRDNQMYIKAGVATGCVAFAIFVISTGIVCSKKYFMNRCRKNDERAKRRKPKAISEIPGSDLANRCTIERGTGQEDSSSLYIDTSGRGNLMGTDSNIVEYMDLAESPVYANTTFYDQDHMYYNASSTEGPPCEVDSDNEEDMYVYI